MRPDLFFETDEELNDFVNAEIAAHRAERDRFMASCNDNDPVWPRETYGEHRPLIPPDVDERIRHPLYVLAKVDDFDPRAPEYSAIMLHPFNVPTRRVR